VIFWAGEKLAASPACLVKLLEVSSFVPHSIDSKKNSSGFAVEKLPKKQATKTS